MVAKILVIGFDKTAEIEMIISVDILRRAKFDVTIANLDDKKHITGDQRSMVKADVKFKDVLNETYDAVVIPGGPDEKSHFPKLAEKQHLVDFLQRHDQAGKLLCGICGAPVIFSQNKIGVGGKMTSFPSDKEDIIKAGYIYEEKDVVVSNNIVTSRGPATAFDFALKIIEILAGEKCSNEIATSLLYTKK